MYLIFVGRLLCLVLFSRFQYHESHNSLQYRVEPTEPNLALATWWDNRQRFITYKCHCVPHANKRRRKKATLIRCCSLLFEFQWIRQEVQPNECIININYTQNARNIVIALIQVCVHTENKRCDRHTDRRRVIVYVCVCFC